VAHIRHSRPESSRGSQVKVFKTSQVIPSSLGSGLDRGRDDLGVVPPWKTPDPHPNQTTNPYQAPNTQLKAQGPSRTCDDSEEEEEKKHRTPNPMNDEKHLIFRGGRPCRVKQFQGGLVFKAHRRVYHSTLGWRVIKKKKKTLSFFRCGIRFPALNPLFKVSGLRVQDWGCSAEPGGHRWGS